MADSSQLIISIALPECHLIPERRQIEHWKLWPLPNGVVWIVNIRPAKFEKDPCIKAIGSCGILSDLKKSAVICLVKFSTNQILWLKIQRQIQEVAIGLRIIKYLWWASHWSYEQKFLKTIGHKSKQGLPVESSVPLKFQNYVIKRANIAYLF